MGDAGAFATHAALFAWLADKYHLTLDQIGRLTPWQVAAVYWHPRTSLGEVDIGYGADPAAGDLRDQWRRHLIGLGLTPTDALIRRCVALDADRR